MQNNQVHAFANPVSWHVFQHIITEGKVYDIINFKQMEAVGNLRHVSSSTKIIFNHTTTVQEVNHPPVFIPHYKFELNDIGELYHIMSLENAEQTPTFCTGKLYVNYFCSFCNVLHRNPLS